jgi:outer membrane protein assembly factor BamA
LHKHIVSYITLALTTVVASCYPTSALEEGEVLYTGIDDVVYENYEKNDHAVYVQEEVAAALDCPPNGAFMGSSTVRTPFPIGLWVWNAFSKSETGFGKWMTKTFGKAPVTVTSVNPEMRSVVATSVLKSHGYFHGNVTSYTKQGSNPKKQKIGYRADMGQLFLLDSIEYVNFPPEAQEIIDSTWEEREIYKGAPFDIVSLDAERSRLSDLFRDNGYFYYQPGYASYLADTVARPGYVQLKLQCSDSLPPQALKKWYIGKIDLTLRKSFMEKTDSVHKGRRLTVHFSGKKMPVRRSALYRQIKIRPGRLYSYGDYLESANNLSNMGIFSMVDFKFTPRDSTFISDSLDVAINCMFEKPYDFYVETNVTGKTTGFLGPQVVVGLTKRNTFGGGEKLDIRLHGSYEWQLGKNYGDNDVSINSYEYGGEVSLEFPRLLLPFESLWGQKNRRRLRRFFMNPSTTIKASSSIINRAGYFTRHIVSGELTYNFQTSHNFKHRLSPLVLEYNYMRRMSDEFAYVILVNPYLLMSMMDQFIPKLRYTLSYTNKDKSRCPISWETTISEAGNLLSLGYMAFGKKWDEKQKSMFNNPYAQFFKFETDFTKTWKVGDYSQLVGHANLGLVYAYGNSEWAPYTEQFYVGGANSIRAFTARTIGPGDYYVPKEDRGYSYMDQMGDMKLLFNLEYRDRLVSNLYWAVFLDAGNVWTLKYDEDRPKSHFKFKNFLSQMAVGTGVGLRYDLDFFVIRLDWGIGLHVPYDTGRSGFYNIDKFWHGQRLNLAIGYPF